MPFCNAWLSECTEKRFAFISSDIYTLMFEIFNSPVTPNSPGLIRFLIGEASHHKNSVTRLSISSESDHAY